jgi:hypothetical protein
MTEFTSFDILFVMFGLVVPHGISLSRYAGVPADPLPSLLCP